MTKSAKTTKEVTPSAESIRICNLLNRIPTRRNQHRVFKAACQLLGFPPDKMKAILTRALNRVATARS